MPPKLKIIGQGYQEQLLDTLHAELCSEHQHSLISDTTTVLARDLTREQVLYDVDLPYLRHRSAATCSEDCQVWLQGGVEFHARRRLHAPSLCARSVRS